MMGCTGMELCLVVAVLNYITISRDQPGPLFLTLTNVPLTKQEFVTELRKVLLAVGFPAKEYAGHSFQIGAATTAALAGVKDSTIQMLGQWQSTQPFSTTLGL